PPPRSPLSPYTTLFRSAVVAHAHHRFAPFAPRAEHDLAARLGVLGGVVEQVRIDLCQARAVALDLERLGIEDDVEGMVPRLDERSEEHTSELQSRVDLV